MRRRATSSARRLLAPALLCLGLAGCGASGSSTTTNVTATGSTLDVWIADPAPVRADPTLQDVVYGEELAFVQQSRDLKLSTLQMRVDRSVTAPEAARHAIEDTSAIAYLGELPAGLSRQTAGITNAEDLLELSATDPVVPGHDDYESISQYGRTFASLVTDLHTPAAALERAVPRGFRSMFLTDFRHAPAPSAVLGYDAMSVLLRVLQRAQGQLNDRTKVIRSVKATLRANAGRADVAAFSIVFK